MIIDNDILFDLPNFFGNMPEALLVDPPWMLEPTELYGSTSATEIFWNWLVFF